MYNESKKTKKVRRSRRGIKDELIAKRRTGGAAYESSTQEEMINLLKKKKNYNVHVLFRD